MKNVFLFSLLTLILFACSKDDPSNPPEDNNNLPTAFKALYNIFEGAGIGAAANLNDDIILFISSNGQDYAWFEDNEIKRTGSVEDEDGLFDGVAFSAISSMIDYDEERLIIFNKVGGTYQWVNLNPESIVGNALKNNHFTFEESTFQLWEWGVDYSCPFDEVTALLGFSKEPTGCNMVEDDDLYMWMVSDDGDEIVRYIKDGSTFDMAIELELFRSNTICGGFPAIYPLSGIGAACVYDPDGGIYQELFFSLDGKQMTILTPSQGSFSEVYDLN